MDGGHVNKCILNTHTNKTYQSNLHNRANQGATKHSPFLYLQTLLRLAVALHFSDT